MGSTPGTRELLSARATVPQLVEQAARGRLLDTAVPTTDVPVFAGLPGGMGTLAEAQLAAVRAAGAEVRPGATVRELERTGTGFALTVGPMTDPERVTADAVVLATPPAPTARLLASIAPQAAAELAGIETASVAIVTFAFPADGVAAIEVTESSGFLVPPVEGRAIKASTFSFAKWAWTGAVGAAAGVAHLRTSLGRHREEASLQATDAELVEVSLSDLAELTGLRARPVDAHVQRWGGGLPQYAVGHLDRVARIRAAVAGVPGLAVCGASYDGVGIPAVIGSAHRAARELGVSSRP